MNNLKTFLYTQELRQITKSIDQSAKDAAIALQVIHCSIAEVSNACAEARQKFNECREGYAKLASIVPVGQYYR